MHHARHYFVRTFTSFCRPTCMLEASVEYWGRYHNSQNSQGHTTRDDVMNNLATSGWLPSYLLGNQHGLIKIAAVALLHPLVLLHHFYHKNPS